MVKGMVNQRGTTRLYQEMQDVLRLRENVVQCRSRELSNNWLIEIMGMKEKCEEISEL